MSLVVTLIPGKQFTQNELVNNAKLNQLGQPSASLTGTLAPADLDAADFSGVLAPGAYFYGVDTGAANAMVVTVTPAVPVYTDGMVLAVKVANANTGATTLALNGLGAASVFKFGNVALIGGELIAGMIVEMRYRLDPNLMANETYNSGGSLVLPVYIGSAYTWTPATNDTSCTYTDGGGAHTATTTTSFTPTTNSVTLAGTASRPCFGSLVAQTGFWELLTPGVPPAVSTFYTKVDQAFAGLNIGTDGGTPAAFVGVYSAANPFGFDNLEIIWSLVNVSAEGGFTAGQEIILPASSAQQLTVFQTWQTSTTFNLFMACETNSVRLVQSGGATYFTPTNAKWTLRVRARRLDV